MAEPKTKFFITRLDNQETYELSATTQVSIRAPLIATDRRVESGKSIVDNTYKENTKVNFSGVISNVSTGSNLTNTDQYLDEIESLRDESPPVLVDVQVENRYVPNCLIETFEYTKTSKEGLGGWAVEMSFKQVSFVERASLVTVPEAAPDQKADLDPQTKQSNNTVQSEDTEVISTIGSDGVGLVFDDNIPTIKSPIKSSTTPTGG